MKPGGGGKGGGGGRGRRTLGGRTGNGPLPQTAGCLVLAVRFTAGRLEGGGGENQFAIIRPTVEELLNIEQFCY